MDDHDMPVCSWRLSVGPIGGKYPEQWRFAEAASGGKGGRGKRGELRWIYYWHTAEGRIRLL